MLLLVIQGNARDRSQHSEQNQLNAGKPILKQIPENKYVA